MTRNDRPNIIHILDDDHRAEQLGCAGHPIVDTPELDGLADEGVLFENAFCTSPACTPSRSSHYLGQWERKHGVNFNSNSSVTPEAWRRSFPMQLKENGYFLGWVGKNHVLVGDGGYRSGYLEEVFDYWYGNHGHSGFYPKQDAGGGDIYENADADTQVEIFEQGALNFLDPDPAFLEDCPRQLPARPDDRPFCLCLTFNLPHGVGTNNMELRPTDDDRYKSRYRGEFRDVPISDTYVPYVESTPPRLPKEVYNDVRIPQYDYVRDPHSLREKRIREYQAISGIDRAIGNLRDKLDALGIADNTIIIFSTDHGLHHGEHGLGGKCLLYEEDLRIPMIVYDPRVPDSRRGQRRSELVVVPDLAPTTLDLVNLEIPGSMQGSSLTPLIRGENVDWREDFFAEQLFDDQNYPRSECVRTGDWKYIRYFERTEDPDQEGPFRGTLDDYDECLKSTFEDEDPIYEELFHLADDPNEEHNLAGRGEHREKLEELRNRTDELAEEAYGEDTPPDTIPLDG